MATKKYVCHQWPSLDISAVQFVDGEVVTDNPSIQEAIEKHEQFGRHIFPVEPTQLPAEGRCGKPDQDLPEPGKPGKPDQGLPEPPRRPGARPDNELPDEEEEASPKPGGGVHQGSRGTGTIPKKK